MSLREEISNILDYRHPIDVTKEIRDNVETYHKKIITQKTDEILKIFEKHLKELLK